MAAYSSSELVGGGERAEIGAAVVSRSGPDGRLHRG